MYFKDVIGQEAVKEKLIKNAHSNRISHAQLFLGPEGSGKLALAIAYARYLACTQPSEHDACGHCSSCLKYNKFAHPDLSFVFPNPSIKRGDTTESSKDYMNPWRSFLEKSPYLTLNGWHNHVGMENKQGIINTQDCSDIIKDLSYKTYESEYKVVIIWMIERLFHSAAPKLLKTLEEPPEKTLFFVVSEKQDLVLNTILSRTQMVKIPRLSYDDISQGLVKNYGCDPTHAGQIAFLSDGNFYTALSILQNKDNFTDNLAFLREWLRSCYGFEMKSIMEKVDALSKMGRENQKALLSFALEIFRQATLMNYRADELVKVYDSTDDFVKKFSKVLVPEVAMLMAEEFTKAIYHVERNANPKILFTDLSLKAFRIMKSKR